MTGTSADALARMLSSTSQIVWRAGRFQPSQFLRVLKRDGLVAVFHQLHPEPVYLPRSVWNTLSERVIAGMLPDRLNAVVSELIECKLFVDGPDVDTKELAQTRTRAELSLNRPTILYLMLAQGCNYKCGYCPIPMLAKQYGENLMSFEDAVCGLKLWEKHIADQPVSDNPYFLIFYGGEPLLNREVLEQLLPYVAEQRSRGLLPAKLKLMLCTNGSLVDERLSKLLASHKVTVAVGLDGPQASNDRLRVTVQGEPTFTAIERAVMILIKDGVRVVASVTISPSNLRSMSAYPDYLRSIGISQFGFNLLKGEAFRRELQGETPEEYSRKAAAIVLEGLSSTGEDGSGYEYQLEKKFSGLRNVVPFSLDCTCYGNQLVIQADGQVTNCPFLRIDQGHVSAMSDDFRINKTQVVGEWRKRLPILADQYPSSGTVLYGGGCSWSSSELAGNTQDPDRVSEIFTEEITNELIWTLLPAEQARDLRGGKTSHWSYRRLRPVHPAGV